VDDARKGPLFTDIVLEIFRLGGLLVSEGDRMGAEYGLTSARWKILGALYIAGEALTVPQIARRMGLTRQAVQRLVDAMSEDGLLRFQDNPSHKRARLIALSEHGDRVYRALYDKQALWAQDLAADSGEEELATTLETLRRIAAALER